MGGEEHVDYLVAAVCDEAGDELPALVSRILVAIVRTLPSYAEARGPGDAEDFRAGLQRGIELCLDCLMDARAPDGSELHALWLIGAQRARQGIPAEDLVRVVDVARRELFDALLSRLGANEDSAPVAVEAARCLVTRLEHVTSAITRSLLEGHAHGLEEWFPVGSRRRAVLVDRLLEGRWTSEAELAQDARAVGRVLGPSTGLLVVVPLDKADHDRLLQAVEDIASAAGEAVEGALRWVPVVHVPVVASVAARSEWERRMRLVEEAARSHEVAVVVIEPTDTVAELVDLYRRAASGLPLVGAARRGPGLVPTRRLSLLRILAGEAGVSDRMAFVRAVLGPVLALPDAEAMLEILDACHAGTGRLADVAVAVHRHENTVRKRLDRIEALTGLSVHVPAERYELETAVHLHKLLLQELQRLDHRL